MGAMAYSYSAGVLRERAAPHRRGPQSNLSFASSQ